MTRECFNTLGLQAAKLQAPSGQAVPEKEKCNNNKKENYCTSHSQSSDSAIFCPGPSRRPLLQSSDHNSRTAIRIAQDAVTTASLQDDPPIVAKNRGLGIDSRLLRPATRSNKKVI